MKTFILLLLSLSCLGSVPRDRLEVVGPSEFSKYFVAKLRGVVGRFQVVLDSAPGEFGDYIIYDCETSNRIHRTVYLRNAPEVGVDRLEVWWVVQVIDHPSNVIGTTFFEGFREYRLWEVGRKAVITNDGD